MLVNVPAALGKKFYNHRLIIFPAEYGQSITNTFNQVKKQLKHFNCCRDHKYGKFFRNQFNLFLMKLTQLLQLFGQLKIVFKTI